MTTKHVGFRITLLTGINNKTCGFLHHQDSLLVESSDLTNWLLSAPYSEPELRGDERQIHQICQI